MSDVTPSMKDWWQTVRAVEQAGPDQTPDMYSAEYAQLLVGVTPGPCFVCRHRQKGQCEWCGGQLGYPALGLPPCQVCPHGRRLA